MQAVTDGWHAACAVGVTDGSFSGGKADNAAVHGTRRVHPDEFAILLDHLQRRPGQPPPRFPARAEVSAQAAPAEAGTLSAAHVRVPAGMRAWARANGFEIGNRGRLPLEVLDAYRHAHDVPAGR